MTKQRKHFFGQIEALVIAGWLGALTTLGVWAAPHHGWQAWRVGVVAFAVVWAFLAFAVAFAIEES
jgi:hypothetical protein